VTINAEVATAFLVLNPRIKSSGTTKVPPPMPTSEDTMPITKPAPAPINPVFKYEVFLSSVPIEKVRLLKKKILILAKKSISESKRIMASLSTFGAMYEPVNAPRMEVEITGKATLLFTIRCFK
jgi:hypothetical protein